MNIRNITGFLMIIVPVLIMLNYIVLYVGWLPLLILGGVILFSLWFAIALILLAD